MMLIKETKIPLEIQSLIEELYKMAAANLMRDGSLLSVAFVIKQDMGLEIYGLASMNNDEEKDATAAMLHQIASRPDVKAIVTMMEAWVMTENMNGLSDEEKEIIRENMLRPSTHPMRKEIINVLVSIKGLDHEYTGMAPISRDENKRPVVSSNMPDLTVNDEMLGRFQGFFIKAKV